MLDLLFGAVLICFGLISGRLAELELRGEFGDTSYALVMLNFLGAGLSLVAGVLMFL